MLCPCGCQETVNMNLVEGSYPRWHLRQHGGGKVSLYPSINRTIGCRSHFWIGENVITWSPGRDRG
ncbi:DUF6527 family protein [Anthocerotibacter panamensis]|uniref:DUF6527 family protein n=1 Tax=Anthocerotibacter panamensis TaxID=2857077 RepID=UPI0036F208E0